MISTESEALVRNGCLNATSLQTIIDSPNFRDYEKAMARELQQLRAQGVSQEDREALREALKDANATIEALYKGFEERGKINPNGEITGEADAAYWSYSDEHLCSDSAAMGGQTT